MKAQTPMLWEKPVPVFIFPKPAKRFSAKEWIMLLKSIILLVNPHILRTRQNKAKWAFSVESPQKLFLRPPGWKRSSAAAMQCC